MAQQKQDEGEIRVRTVRSTRPNGDIYVMERRTRYDPEKKYNQVLSSRVIGIIPRGSAEMIPAGHTRKSPERTPAPEPPPVPSVQTGSGGERTSLAQRTAEQLYSQIAAEKRYRPGDKLPNEMELSREFGVSRATLREAVRDLTLQGILEVRRGRGTYVAERAVTDAGFSRLERIRGQLRDLFELRSIFEPAAASLACIRASEAELEEILRCGEEAEKCIQSGEDRSAADRAFHNAIVRAAHNEYMLQLLPVIDRAVDTAIGDGGHREELARSTLHDHAMLMEFIRRRDAEGAGHAMAIHMRHAMDEMGLET